ncbi:MAG: alpha-2-macroglobulin family protein [Bdellovibrionota bacterium]|jgi:uncharacterized protein YfaS (alpha-2-macroglobulin family)
MKITKKITTFLVLFFSIFLSPHSALALHIIRMTPTGEDVPNGQEMVIQFDTQMAPFGSAIQDISKLGIKLSPEVPCDWRWISTDTLACRIKNGGTFLPATKYEVLVPAGIKALNGSELVDEFRRSFITQRPRILSLSVVNWLSPALPVLRVDTNLDIDLESLENVLSLRFDESSVAVNATLAKYDDGEVMLRRYDVIPVKDLPLDKKISVHITKGLSAKDGTELGEQEEDLDNFNTFGDFKLLALRCWSYSGSPIRVSLSEKQSEKCNPVEGMELVFSAPLSKDGDFDVQLEPKLISDKARLEMWRAQWRDTSLYTSNTEEGFNAKLYEFLPANRHLAFSASAGSLKDAFNRPLQEPFNLTLLTGSRPPRFVFDHEVSVLEKGVDSHLPIYLTNIDNVAVSYTSTTATTRDTGVTNLKGYNVEDLSYRYPFKVRDLLGDDSGVIEGKITPEKLKSTWFFSQVTPFHVHAKLGHFNSLVWVTSFADGKPVSDAAVEIVNDQMEGFGRSSIVLAKGKTNRDGVAILPGLESLDPKLTLVDEWDRKKNSLMVKVTKDRDLALVPSKYNFKVYDWDIGSYISEKYGHLQAWGTTTQGIYRAGEAIAYKIFVRNQNNSGFGPAPREGYSLKLVDPLGNVVEERKDLTLSEFGTVSGEFVTSKNATSGWYYLELRGDFAGNNLSWRPLKVLVSDFTPAAYQVRVALDKKKYLSGDLIKLDTSATLYAGGPYAEAPLRVTSYVAPSEIKPKKEELKDFVFADEKDRWESQDLSKTSTYLDKKGLNVLDFKVPDLKIPYGTVQVESAVSDDRGKSVAATTQAVYAGLDRYVGVSQKDWILEAGKTFSVDVIVVNDDGELVSDTPADVVIKRKIRKATRVKSAGNAYITKYSVAWKVVERCALNGAATIQKCAFVPDKSGTYRIRGIIKDTKGRKHSSSLDRFAIGSEFTLFASETDNALDLQVDKSEYRVGDIARVLVKNPYPKARALITTERYGIKTQQVKVLNESSEVLTFPITKGDLPGFYVSVVVMSPRVEEKPLENDVDLGKPAFAMGYAAIKVVGDEKKLNITVSPQEKIYKPRAHAVVDINVKTPSGDIVPTELAAIVLDESVFDLIKDGIDYFDPYKGFYDLQPLDVVNLNIIAQLVGRQNFEKKGANPGGGGAATQDMRSQFKFVAYWNPSVMTDEKGRAKIEFDLPDNLTSWRVLVIAADKIDRMGVNFADFKVNQPTEIRPALPNQIRVGDSFTARATVMNRTENTRTLSVKFKASGPVDDQSDHQQSIIAEPFKRIVIELPLTVTEVGTIKLNVTAGDALDSDSTVMELPVSLRKNKERVGLNGSLVAHSKADDRRGSVAIPFAFPKDIYVNDSALTITASSTLLGTLEGAFAKMRDYPYPCWEQKLSRAVMSALYGKVQKSLPESFKWEDGGFKETTKIIAEALDFQAPNGGMTFFVAQDQYVSAYLSAYTALAFSWLRQLGYEIPTIVEEKLDNYLLSLLREDNEKNRAELLTVRSVIVAALADRAKVDYSEVNRLLPYLEEMSLFSKANLLQALLKTSAPLKEREKVFNSLLTYGDETSGKLSFTERADLSFVRMLDSQRRSDCAVLLALLDYKKATTGDDTVIRTLSEKLVRSIATAKGKDGAWNNTQENAFCTTALVNYGSIYEGVTPDFVMSVALGDEKLAKFSFAGDKHLVQEVTRTIKEEDLGRSTELKFSATDKGRAYYTATLAYAPKGVVPETNAGIAIKREYSLKRGDKFELLKEGQALETGDIMRVDLFVMVPTERNYVVLEDPLPAGVEAVNTDLATTSANDAYSAGSYSEGSFIHQHKDWNTFGSYSGSFYHRELKHEVVRYYADDRLSAGNYHLSYLVQVIAPGKFIALPPHVEEMYNPDIFGRGQQTTLTVAK